MKSAHRTHRRALTSDFPCRPSLIALGVHVEFAVAATRPVVARQPVAQGAGEAVTANAHAPAVAPASRAINCNRAVPSKACKKCGAVKPRTEFQGNPRCADGRVATCRACTNTARNRTDAERRNTVHTAREGTGTLSPRVVAVTAQATAKLVTFDTLTADARRLKGQPAVHWHGRSKITAVFDKKTDTTRYAVSGWPCPADDLQYIFRLIESGQPVRGLP